MAKRDIFSLKSIREKKYINIDMGVWGELFGEVEGRFVAMFYGPGGSGKSVLALQFAEFLASKWGKVLYDSHEEGVRKTLQSRIIKFNIQHPRLSIGNKLSHAKTLQKIKSNYYRVLVVDSIQWKGFTPDQFKELMETFAKRQFSIIMVSFGTRNNPDCHKHLFHSCDIKAYFENGKVEVTSRYLDRPVHKPLFKPDQAQLGGLFSQPHEK